MKIELTKREVYHLIIALAACEARFPNKPETYTILRKLGVK